MTPALSGLALLGLTLLYLTGCASNLARGDRFFAARAYGEAAKAYEAILAAGEAGAHQERVLFRLALAYSMPGSPIHDETRARELFAELAERFDSGPYRAQAVRILELESLRDELREESWRRRRQQSAGAEADTSALEKLRRTLERLDAEISECREQLEKLKAIDLGGSR